MPLSCIPVGVEIHNVEMIAGQGGKLVRTAGGVARLMAKEGDWATIILPSGEMRMVRKECRATIGQLGNPDYQNVASARPAGCGIVVGADMFAARPRTRLPTRWAAAKAGPTADGIRVRRRACLAKGGKTRNPRKTSNSASGSFAVAARTSRGQQLVL